MHTTDFSPLYYSPLQWLPQVAFELIGTRAPALPGKLDTRAGALDRAMAHFEHSEWREAFAKLVPLADAGDREAARIALLMTTRGPRLFGRAFAASPAQRQRWQAATCGAYAPP